MAENIREPKERILYLTNQIDQSTVSDITKEIVAINQDDDNLIKIAKINGFRYKPPRS